MNKFNKVIDIPAAEYYSHTIACNEELSNDEVQKVEENLKKLGITIHNTIFPGFRSAFFCVTVPEPQHKRKRLLAVIKSIEGVENISPKIDPIPQRPL